MHATPHTPSDLAAFQAALLDALSAGGPPAVIRERILSRISDPHLRDYVIGFDERMLTVASELVQKWARR